MDWSFRAMFGGKPVIAFVRGTVVEKQPTRCVVDVGGVGYEVFIPLSSFDRLPAKGETCTLLTHDYVREDTHQLFGFVSESEREMFTLLIGVGGIGPRLALSALSGLTVRELTTAIVSGDVKRLSSVSGVGKKMAERIVVELRHKISDADAMEAVSGADDKSPESVLLRDALLALVALGYTQEQARKMVKQALGGANPPDNVEEIVRRALSR